MTSVISVHSVVIGGGMTGLAVAYYLARRGMRSTVLERSHIGAGASGRNAGMVITGLGEHYARSIAKFGRERARQIWEINRQNHRLLREMIEEERIECDYERTGSIAVGWDDEETEDLKNSIRPLHEDGFRAVFWPRSSRMYSPEDAQLQPVRLIWGMARAVRRHGVDVRENAPVARIERDANGFRVQLPSEEISCRRIILATNAYTPELLPGARLTPVIGRVVAFRAPQGFRFSAPHYTDRGNLYWRSYQGYLIFGGEERLEEFAEKTVGRALTAVARWSGVMGYGFDWFPLIGEVEAGMHIAAGFTGHGFGYAFQAAKWIAEEAEIPQFLRWDRV